jgi:hypothetical protein
MVWMVDGTMVLNLYDITCNTTSSMVWIHYSRHHRHRRVNKNGCNCFEGGSYDCLLLGVSLALCTH